jgi:hypothetical protein
MVYRFSSYRRSPRLDFYYINCIPTCDEEAHERSFRALPPWRSGSLLLSSASADALRVMAAIVPLDTDGYWLSFYILYG